MALVNFQQRVISLLVVSSFAGVIGAFILSTEPGAGGGSPVGMVVLILISAGLPSLLLAAAARGGAGTALASLFLIGLVIVVTRAIRADESSTAAIGIYQIFFIGTAAGLLAWAARTAVEGRRPGRGAARRG